MVTLQLGPAPILEVLVALRSRKSPRLVVLICGPYVLVKRSGGCGKVLLRSELRAFRAHLLPHQLADGVRSVEVMPRLHRQRLQHHGADIDRVCLPYDEATPTTLSIDIFFDQDAAGWCPGWADGWNTLIPQIWLPRCFVMIRSFTLLLGGGSKGACHAVVQCLLLESLGVALLLEGSTIQCLCCPLLPGSTSPHVLLMMAYLRPFWQSPTQLAPLARNPATAWAAAL